MIVRTKSKNPIIYRSKSIIKEDEKCREFIKLRDSSHIPSI